MVLPALLLVVATSMAAPEPARFEGRFFRGEGDVEYLELLDISRRMFDADPEFQNVAMLYTPRWNGFVEGPTWGAWWIQNSYGPTYCALPFYTEPYTTFLQNAQDLWFDQMGDGKRLYKWRNFEWKVPDGQLCDAAAPDWVVPKQGDGRVDIHDWGVEFTAAGLLMQAELLLISRDGRAIEKYLPKLERCANFLETRRDAEKNLFLAGPAGNLLAPSYAGWKKEDGSFGMAYLAGLSITTIAALDRLIELEKLAGNPEKTRLYTERRDPARKGLLHLITEEGYFIKSLDPDGTRHGVYGAEKYGYFEAVSNHDAICFRVADDVQSEKIYSKIASIPGLRRHNFIITNHPSLDDMYVPDSGWLWQHGTWVNGGHWSTCEARMVMAYYRLGKYEDARRSMEELLKFARPFRMDNPLVNFGSAVYQPGEAINLCYDSFGPPAALVRGLFEYLYRADGLTLIPHVPPGITRLEQHFPIRFGSKRIYLATYGRGSVASVLLNGKPWKRFDEETVFLPFHETPERALIQIVFGKGEVQPFLPETSRPELPPPREIPEDLYSKRFPPITANDLPLRIGADSQGGSRFLGDIALARIFSRTLDAGEVEALFRQAPGSNIEDPTLAGAWTFENGLPGKTVGEVDMVDSPHGKALHLTGKGFIEIADDPKLDLTKACTLEAWICPGELPPSGGRIIDKTTVGASDGYLIDTYPGNSLRMICERGSLGHDAKLAPGKWAHVAATIAADGSLALYINGQQVASEKKDSSLDLAGLQERVERIRKFYRRLTAAGLESTCEGRHARLAVEYLETFHRRLELQAEKKLSMLPPRSQFAADKSYIDTAAKLCDGLEKTLKSYDESSDSHRKRLSKIWQSIEN